MKSRNDSSLQGTYRRPDGPAGDQPYAWLIDFSVGGASRIRGCGSTGRAAHAGGNSPLPGCRLGHPRSCRNPCDARPHPSSPPRRVRARCGYRPRFRATRDRPGPAVVERRIAEVSCLLCVMASSPVMEMAMHWHAAQLPFHRRMRTARCRELAPYKNHNRWQRRAYWRGAFSRADTVGACRGLHHNGMPRVHIADIASGCHVDAIADGDRAFEMRVIVHLPPRP